MLGQAEIGRLFDRCGTDTGAIEEVLSAYLANKFAKGYTADAVFGKLRHLIYYLRGSGRTSLLEVGREQFTTLAFEVQNGGGRIGVCPAMSEAGKEAWNQLRKANAKRALPFTTHQHGGPGSVLGILAEHQLPDISPDAERNPQIERYFRERYKLNAPPPPYEQDRFGHGGNTTLPLYESAGSRQEVVSGEQAILPEDSPAADCSTDRSSAEAPVAGPSMTHNPS